MQGLFVKPAAHPPATFRMERSPRSISHGRDHLIKLRLRLT